MDEAEARKMSHFFFAAEEYRKSLSYPPLIINQGRNGRGHEVKLIYRFTEISPSGKQILVHFTKREEYRKVVGYQRIGRRRFPIYGDLIRKDSETLSKLPYRHEEASYLWAHYTKETLLCKNHIVTSVFDARLWPSGVIKEVGNHYMKMIDEAEKAKISKAEGPYKTAISREKAIILNHDKKSRKLEKEEKSLSKKLDKANRQLASSKEKCPIFLLVITFGIASFFHCDKVVQKCEKKVALLEQAIKRNEEETIKNNEIKKKSFDAISSYEEEMKKDISSIKKAYLEVREEASFYINDPIRVHQLLNEDEAKGDSPRTNAPSITEKAAAASRFL